MTRSCGLRTWVDRPQAAGPAASAIIVNNNVSHGVGDVQPKPSKPGRLRGLSRAMSRAKKALLTVFRDSKVKKHKANTTSTSQSPLFLPSIHRKQRRDRRSSNSTFTWSESDESSEITVARTIFPKRRSPVSTTSTPPLLSMDSTQCIDVSAELRMSPPKRPMGRSDSETMSLSVHECGEFGMDPLYSLLSSGTIRQKPPRKKRKLAGSSGVPRKAKEESMSEDSTVHDISFTMPSEK